MDTVLITGGAGFIGSHLTRLLVEKGFIVRILDVLSPQIHGKIPSGLAWLNDKNIEYIRGSVTERRDVELALQGVKYIVHMAAETGTGQSMYEIAHYNYVNLQGTAIFLDIIANKSDHGVERIILASSRSVYGDGAYKCIGCGANGQRLYPASRAAAQLAARQWEPFCKDCNTPLKAIPTHETDPVRPASIYAANKLAQEDLVRIACQAQGLSYAILRFQNVYGEGQSLNNPYTGILSIFSTRVRRGLVLPIFEDGLESRDFVHVDDVARAVYCAMTVQNPPNAIINIGSGVATSVIDTAEILAEALGAQANIRVTSDYRIGDIRHNYADIELLRTALGYVPRISLDEGIRRFADWVLTQPLPDDLLEKANAELRARKLMG
jgi:dTDP-L-rhamnose 4-epimerase